MKFKSIVDISKPLVYWTGESHNTTNVFDEYNKVTLVATAGATLGSVGTDNQSFSNRSINLNGGTVSVADGSFLTTQVTTRRLTLTFLLRVDATNIAGFTPLIGRWSPTQEFAIVFENGDLVAKVNTTSGIVSIIYPYKKVIYNNRFNTITLEINATDIVLTVNGVDFSITDSAPIISDSGTLFTLGSTITENVYISDIAVTEVGGVSGGFRRAAYVLTHTNDDMFLDYAPTYYYPVSRLTDFDAPVPNRGSVPDADCYLVYDPAGPAPYILTPQDSNANITAVRMPSKSWFSIDKNNLQFDTTAGVSIVARSKFDPSLTNTNFPFRVLDLSNIEDNNNGRLVLNILTNDQVRWNVYNNTGSSDSTGVLTSNFIYLDGVKLISISGTNFKVVNARYNDFSLYDNDILTTFTWNGTLSLDSNRFWYNGGEGGAFWTELSDFALFDYVLPENVARLLTYPSFKAEWFLMSDNIDIDNDQAAIIAYGASLTSPDIKEDNVGTSFLPYNVQVNTTFQSPIIDLNYNRSDAWTESGYLLDSSSYIGPGASSFITDPKHTMNIFLWNRNTTTRYELYKMTNNGFIIWMNSRDGAFSYGDVEYVISSDSVSSFSKPCIDFGFNMLTFVRDGNNMQIWINAQLEAEITTPTITTLSASNQELRGGPCYYNNYSFWFKIALTPQQIEFLFAGFADNLQGQCTLSNAPLASRLLIADTVTGKVLKTQNTDSQGKFDLNLIKTEQQQRVNVIAMALNDADSNNVVIHGPYNATTTYSKFTEEYILQTIDDMILDMEPYAYYKMNEQSGTVLADSSGNIRNGTIVGTVTLNNTGTIESDPSILLDGSSGYFALPSGYATMSNGFTFETLINFTAFNNNARIFDFSAAVNASDGIYLNSIGTTDDLSFSSQTGLANNGSVSALNSIQTSVWAHVVARMAQDGTYSIWVNGDKINESNFTIAPNSLRLLSYIGRSSNAAHPTAAAAYSHTVTYEYPLSDEDINKHARRSQGRASATLRAAITQDKPDIYFPFTRTEQYTDAINSVVLAPNIGGTFTIRKNSIEFPIGNNYLTTTAYRLPTSTDGWSIVLGIKTATTQGNAIVVSEWSSGATAGTYKVQLESDNTIRVYFGTDSTSLTSTTLYNTDTWTHITVLFDGVTTSLYINGTSEDSSAIITHAYNLYDMTIGNASDGSGIGPFTATASVNDIAIFSRNIGTSRVSEHNTRFIKKKVYQ